MAEVIEPRDLTSGEKQGAGFFEEIMRTVNSMIHEEYTRERIVGTDYANVYLGTMTAALATASQFILQYELTNQQLILISEQIKQAQENTALIQAQIRNMDADTAIKTKQLTVMDKQLDQMDAQIAQTNKQVEQITKQIESMVKQDLLTDAQTSNTLEQTKLVEQNIINTANQNTTITKQQLKIDKETELLDQKLKTEQAQIVDVVDGANVMGVIGKQKDLYTAQKDGFIRDAEQKASKIYTDVWISLLSTLGSAEPDQAGFSNSNTAKMMDKLREGIGVV